jgi:hypothetical protein
MVSWAVTEAPSNNMIYIYILLGVLILMDIIACVHYLYVFKFSINKKKSKKKAKTI